MLRTSLRTATPWTSASPAAEEEDLRTDRVRTTSSVTNYYM